MPFSQIRTGNKAVVTAGTRLQLKTVKQLAKSLIIKAPASNSGIVYIGDLTVTAATGFALAAGESVSLTSAFNPEHIIDLSRTYVDAATDGDSVTFTYFEDYTA